MIYLDGLKKVEKIPWRDIQPGMIFLGGIRINDTIPFELRNFPVLTTSLLDELLKKYCFLSRRDILIVKAKAGYSPSKLSGKLLEARDKIEKINAFRHAFLSAKVRILKECGLNVSIDTSFLDTGVVDKRFLIQDTYNSFGNPYSHLNEKRIPSFFHSLKLPITLGQALTGNLSLQGNLPMDEQVLLHVVVDYSSGMDQEGKREHVFAALEFYYTFLREILKNTEIKVYAFSDECKPVSFPLSGKEVPKKGSHYASFVKKVLHHKDTNQRNKVILFSDKAPTDAADALHYGRLFKKNNIDYTQIIFSKEGLKNPDEQEDRIVSLSGETSQFARVCGGNQVLVKRPEGAPLVFLETYDRYLGILTLIDPGYNRPITQKQTSNLKDDGKEIFSQGKVVKKWQPKKIKRRN